MDSPETLKAPEGMDDYELRAWLERLGSMPVKRVAHTDRSESYTMDRASVWELENGQFALIAESGCSCYEAADASIDLHPNQEAAIAAYEKWLKYQ